MDAERLKSACERLLEPYVISEDCPYLSEDQRELSQLSLHERSLWMGEWLRLAQATDSSRVWEKKLKR